MVKLGFDRAQIGKDVGVIVFQVIQYGRLRVVMDKLAAFVEKRRVVLIGFDNKSPHAFHCV
jgi:hypothetical protein